MKDITGKGEVTEAAQANYHSTYRYVNCTVKMFTELSLMIYDFTNVKQNIISSFNFIEKSPS
jgi:hypothetical protein